MSDTKRCSACGAQNSVTADWCTLCLTRFDGAVIPPPSPEPEPEAAQEPASLASDTTIDADLAEAVAVQDVADTPPPPAPVAQAAVKFVREGDKVRWVCPSCDTVNDIDSGSCRICGTVMAQLFAPTKPAKKAQRSMGVTLALSALLPGLGHFVHGDRATAVGRALLYLWTAGISVLLIARAPVQGRAVVQAVGFAFAAAAVGIWIVSLMESRRLAAEDRRPIVAPRVITWIFTGLTLALFLGVLVAAAAGRSG